MVVKSAGASLLTRDGKAWSTDKDGIALCLLAAEIMSVTGKTPSEYYRTLTDRFGEPFISAWIRLVRPKRRRRLKT
ncbi:hypothetical protein HSBAA_20770 [Vreelandella sulfidaeris]|uniref:Alpha-D-phosphohexomutase alpha/beta/alpha domain-containing protein n=1 Tax=Vreelandella sulfidaeris TaxID=115553 RepID=A0A455U8E1_9GAMM|nr:hypothetical protein HSBAA_20770 [Halomonas sulfidaeris]